MTPRSLVDRLLSPAGFGLALLLLLLPLVTVSCNGEVAGADDDVTPGTYTYGITFTGLDLVTGGDPDLTFRGPDEEGRYVTTPLDAGDVEEFRADYAQYYPAQPLAVAAALVLLGGMAGAFLLPGHLRGPITGAAAIAALALLAMQVLVLAPMLAADALAAENLPQETHEVVFWTETRPAIGFYLTAAVLVALLVREFLVARRAAAPVAGLGSPAQPTDAPAGTDPPPQAT